MTEAWQKLNDTDMPACVLVNEEGVRRRLETLDTPNPFIVQVSIYIYETSLIIVFLCKTKSPLICPVLNIPFLRNESFFNFTTKIFNDLCSKSFTKVFWFFSYLQQNMNEMSEMSNVSTEETASTVQHQQGNFSDTWK